MSSSFGSKKTLSVQLGMLFLIKGQICMLWKWVYCVLRAKLGGFVHFVEASWESSACLLQSDRPRIRSTFTVCPPLPVWWFSVFKCTSHNKQTFLWVKRNKNLLCIWSCHCFPLRDSPNKKGFFFFFLEKSRLGVLTHPSSLVHKHWFPLYVLSVSFPMVVD